MTKNEYISQVQLEDQNVNRLFRHMGTKVLSMEDGEATLALPVGEHLLQGMGLVAGGVLATLADEAMAHAVMSKLEPEQRIVTVELNIRYLRAADPKNGNELRCAGRVIKWGRHIITTEASVTDLAGRLLATSGGSFWILTPEDDVHKPKD